MPFATTRGLLIPTLLILLGGCGAGMVGDYRAEVRVREGEQESNEPGYTLAEVRAKLEKSPRLLTLHSDGRYMLRRGDSTNEGTWRVEEDTVILLDDTSNGVHIQEGLRREKRLQIEPNGDLVDKGTYGYYNLETVYARQ